MPPSPLTAYLDESIDSDSGLYVLAAREVRPAARQKLIDALPIRRRPHWHAEDQPTRAKLVAATAGLPLEARAYGCRFGSPRRMEAARARALTWLVFELDVEIRTLILDRRDAVQDAKDRRLLAPLFRRRPGVEYGHVPSASEPLLWVADVVAGAMLATWLNRQDHVTGGLDAVLSRCEREPG